MNKSLNFFSSAIQAISLTMTCFLASQNNTRRGKWTAEEELYAAFLIESFSEGSLDDVDEGFSLRSYLAKKLRTNVKRISKKVRI